MTAPIPRHLAATLILLALLAANRAHALFFPHPDEPWLFVDTWFYDPSGHAGLVETHRSPNQTPDTRTVIAIGDTSPTLSSYASLNVTLPTAGPAGTPFSFRLYHPAFGCLAGYSQIGVLFRYHNNLQMGGAHPEFSIPVPPAAFVHPLELDNSPFDGDDPPNGETTLVRVGPRIGDTKLAPSLVVPATTIPDADQRSAVLRVTYLDGNRYTGQTEKRFDPATASQNGGVNYLMYWTGLPDPGYSNGFYLGEEAPVGPLRLELEVEGYEPDTVEFDAENLKTYSWVPLLVPLPGPEGGPSPSMLMATSGILAQGVSDDLLGECQAAMTLADPTDRNADGVRDIGDLIPPP